MVSRRPHPILLGSVPPSAEHGGWLLRPHDAQELQEPSQRQESAGHRWAAGGLPQHPVCASATHGRPPGEVCEGVKLAR